MKPLIRRAEPRDVGAILGLIQALARFEREPDAVQATEASLLHSLFSADANVFAHVAEREGQVLGIAIWFLNFSTWTGRCGLYLEDLIVDERARGSGIGRSLFRALAMEARARDAARIDWAVLDWNQLAIDFYRRIGARPQAGWQPWRLDGAALEALADMPA